MIRIYLLLPLPPKQLPNNLDLVFICNTKKQQLLLMDHQLCYCSYTTHAQLNFRPNCDTYLYTKKNYTKYTQE